MTLSTEPPIRRITGALTLVLRDREGVEVARRRAQNTVLRGGAERGAAGLTGQARGVPLNAAAVGVDATPSSPPYEISALATTSGSDTLADPTVVTLTPDAFSIETQTDRLRVRVGVRAVLPPGTATGVIREAGLGTLGSDGRSLAVLYNRVILEPIDKASDQELALYWDIFFPYGT